ncbi:MAG: crotonase/enoyl-CoA hydratase family protein [Myxococcota bacterium]
MTQPALLSYDLDTEGIATVAMDDGKVNAMSPAMLRELHGAFDRAEADGAVVRLLGRPGIFSAGFDLGVFQQGEGPTREMLRLGATLCERVLGFPRPVVAGCTGHAYPMGAFLLLCADRRVGAAGDFRLGLNEVAIGLTLPLFAVEVARQRMTPAFFQRTVTGDLYDPQTAVTAGILDEVVAPEAVADRAREIARGLAGVDREAHAGTKLRVRESARSALRAAIDSELGG